MYDKDVVMLQLGAALIEPNEFLLILLHKFGLLNWAREDYDTEITPEDSVKQLISLAEHFFKLIIVLFCERYVCLFTISTYWFKQCIGFNSGL